MRCASAHFTRAAAPLRGRRAAPRMNTLDDADVSPVRSAGLTPAERDVITTMGAEDRALLRELLLERAANLRRGLPDFPQRITSRFTDATGAGAGCALGDGAPLSVWRVRLATHPPHCSAVFGRKCCRERHCRRRGRQRGDAAPGSLTPPSSRGKNVDDHGTQRRLRCVGPQGCAAVAIALHEA